MVTLDANPLLLWYQYHCHERHPVYLYHAGVAVIRKFAGIGLNLVLSVA
jgi:hypothetical protein